MTKAEFTDFTARALEDLIQLAEDRAGKPVSRNVAFKWMGSKDEPLRENILEAIVDRVFVNDDAIYPCVDIGIVDLLDDGTPLLQAGIAGYGAEPFGQNWTGREGPYVRIVGAAFIAKMGGKPYPAGGVLSASIVDM